MKKQFHVAVVGASGMVGQQVLESLRELSFPAASVRAFASTRSTHHQLDTGHEKIDVQPISPNAFEGVQVAFFAVNHEVARQYCPQAIAAGAVCIDKSSAHRMHEDVPLVVPEVNPAILSGWRARHIVASPNCVVIPLVRVLHALRQDSCLKRVVVCSYQAASGLGKQGIQQLQQQTQELLQNKPPQSMDWAKQLAFNVLPCIPESGKLSEAGSSAEEDKIVLECRKILEEPQLSMEATCVRVPVLHGHAAAVHVEFAQPMCVKRAVQLLEASPGMRLFHSNTSSYPTPAHVAGSDTVAVGRIRLDRSVKNGLVLWLCSDNIRVGAAVNAVQTARLLCEQHWTA
ncbi:MAG: aspartate-semialdehyde dehydrogenase [Myxococcota bacterium]